MGLYKVLRKFVAGCWGSSLIVMLLESEYVIWKGADSLSSPDSLALPTENALHLCELLNPVLLLHFCFFGLINYSWMWPFQFLWSEHHHQHTQVQFAFITACYHLTTREGDSFNQEMTARREASNETITKILFHDQRTQQPIMLMLQHLTHLTYTLVILYYIKSQNISNVRDVWVCTHTHKTCRYMCIHLAKYGACSILCD